MGWKSFFTKEKKEDLNQGLEKTKKSFFSKIASSVAGKSKVDDDVLDDLEEILGRLQDNNVSFEKVTVPELGTTQIFFSDPDGIQIELNFDCQDSGIPT